MTTEPAVAGEAPAGAPLAVTAVTLARLRPGAQLLTDRKGANDTYFSTIYCDDYEGSAYVKDLEPIALANELLAAVLGIAGGLPMPRPFLVFVDKGLLTTAHGPLLSDGSARLAFATESSPFEQLGRADQVLALAAVKKWRHLADTICFDEWIANGDRHLGNILFQAPDRFLLIDHSHVFTGPAWTPGDLQPDRGLSNKLLEEWPGLADFTNDERHAVASGIPNIVAKFGRIRVSQAIMASFVAHVLDTDRQRALVDFLPARCQHVTAAILRRLGIPALV